MFYPIMREYRKITPLNWKEYVDEAVIRRKEQRLTQKQLAVLAGVSGPTR